MGRCVDKFIHRKNIPVDNVDLGRMDFLLTIQWEKKGCSTAVSKIYPHFQ